MAIKEQIKPNIEEFHKNAENHENIWNIFECNMELMSKELAQELNLIIDQKKSIAKQVLIEDTENLSFLKRLRNNAFRLITPYY